MRLATEAMEKEAEMLDRGSQKILSKARDFSTPRLVVGFPMGLEQSEADGELLYTYCNCIASRKHI